MIPDGARLKIGGFMGVDMPERLVDEIVRQGKRDLTVIANDTAKTPVGVNTPPGPLPPALMRSMRVPCGVSSTWIITGD